MDRNIQQPLFAPAHATVNPVDDFDLNEIFAEYFINEFDDPLNAYTSSMANFSGGVNVVGIMQDASVNSSFATQSITAASQTILPTGGIRTAFHTGTPVFAAQPPPAKKIKEESIVTSTTSALTQNLMRSMQSAPHAALSSPQLSASGGISLPVGVGIRLGGVGAMAIPAVSVVPNVTNQVGMSVPYLQQAHFPSGGDANGGFTDHATEERRQRNREHAKRSRVRKKFMLESLQSEVQQLQRENLRLRLLVQENIPEEATKIISECCSTSPLFSDDDPNYHGKRNEEKLLSADFTLMQSLTAGQQCFVLSDPKLPDNPIVFASPGFYRLTGYTSKEVLGRNCRFLQGPGTDTRAVDVIRKAIMAGSDATVCLLNYKADGTPFWNQFFLAALRDSENCIVNYVGVQCEVEPQSDMNILEEKVNEVLPLPSKDEKSNDEDIDL